MLIDRAGRLLLLPLKRVCSILNSRCCLVVTKLVVRDFGEAVLGLVESVEARLWRVEQPVVQ